MYFSICLLFWETTATATSIFVKIVPFWRQMQMRMYFFITHLVIFTGNSSSKHFSYKKLLSLQSSLPSLFCLIKTVPTLSLFSSKPTGPCTTKNTRIFKKNWRILLFKSSFCLHAKQFFCFCVLKESVASCLLIKRLIQNLSCYRRLYLQLIPRSLCFEYHLLSLQLAWIFGLKASHISSL